jgi:hypothetical protein
MKLWASDLLAVTGVLYSAIPLQPVVLNLFIIPPLRFGIPIFIVFDL